jgi:rhodanese-related sulfurtransferase
MPLPEFKQLVDEAKRQIQEIRPAELAKMQQSGQTFLLIDVRERDEQSKGTIPGAVTLPRGILERDIDQLTTDKHQPIIVYCAGGYRSALAALNLKKMGFENVISLDGGYKAWAESQPK